MPTRTTRTALLLLLAAGCSRGPGPGPAPSASPPLKAKPGQTEATYTLKGVLKAVDPATGEVTIDHEEVPGFMTAMVMPFTIKDRAGLDEVRPGDGVEGKLTVVSEGGVVENYELSALVVTRPSLGEPPPPLATDPGPKLLEPGQPVPDFAVTLQDGTTARLSDLKGNAVALTFIYTRCPLPDFCPALDAKFAELARRVGTDPARAARARLISISFDPAHDTPEVLRAHAKLRGARPPLWSFAVASHEELAKVAPALGLSYAPATNQIDHNLRAALIAPDGTLDRLETGRDWSPSEMARRIDALLSAGGR